MAHFKSILLIDDDSISNYLVSLIIDSLEKPYPYHIASNAIDALSYLRTLNEPCRVLVLLDIHMPVLDGFEFLKYLESVEEIEKNLLEIVIISSSIAQKDLDNAKISGIEKFLVKPINKEGLQIIINAFELV